MRKTWLVSLCLAASAAPALAEWVKVADSEGSTFYLETPLPKKVGKNVMLLVLRDHSTLRFNAGLPYRSSKDQLEADCFGRRIRRLYASDHVQAMGEGAPVRFEHGPMSWNDVQPNTVLAQIVDLVCKAP